LLNILYLFFVGKLDNPLYTFFNSDSKRPRRLLGTLSYQSALLVRHRREKLDFRFNNLMGWDWLDARSARRTAWLFLLVGSAAAATSTYAATSLNKAHHNIFLNELNLAKWS